jgi:hypothetical protein
MALTRASSSLKPVSTPPRPGAGFFFGFRPSDSIATRPTNFLSKFSLFSTTKIKLGQILLVQLKLISLLLLHYRIKTRRNSSATADEPPDKALPSSPKKPVLGFRRVSGFY